MPAERYYLNGRRIPGCTTSVTGQLGWSAQALKYWAFKTARVGARVVAGIDGPLIQYDYETLNDYSAPADIGTFAHAAVEADLKGEELDLAEVPKEQLRAVERIFARWREWKSTRIAEVLLSEKPLRSPTYRFGGRPDMVFRSPDGRVWLLDLKTGGLYPEHLVQVAAYALLVEDAPESGVEKIDALAVLRIGRDTEGVVTMERPWVRDSTEAQAVHHCLALYKIQRQLEAEV